MAVAPQSLPALNLLSDRAIRSADQPIGRLMAEALKYPDLVSLAAGFVDNATLPVDVTAAALEHVAQQRELLRRGLQYDASAGSMRLREALADWCYRDYPNVKVLPEQLILTAGSNQLLHLTAEAILNEGDIVVAAAPTYFVFMGTLKSMGARVVGVPADEDGILIDALERQLEEIAARGDARRVKAIYLVTDFDNPAGSTLSLSRRHRIIEIARQWREQHGPLLIISDNAYTELRYSGETLPPLISLADDAKDFVIEAGTFSKSFSPGVRIGWGVIPHEIVEPMLSLKSGMDFGSPHLNQLLMNDIVRSGALDRHLPSIRAGYSAKLSAILAALDDCLGNFDGVTWRHPVGGLYVWLKLPEHIDTSESGRLWQLATKAGVLYVPGHYCYASEGCAVERNTIRLSFGVQDARGLRLGIERLASAIEGCL